jgi:mRNA-degrading endonuclease RelE of RelBE toxin-antitoxin system
LFNLIFTEEFKKNFDKLKDKDVRTRILKKAIELKSKPTKGRTLTGIDDAHFGRLYRLRVGKYRVIYALKYETNEIYLITVGHRKNVYGRLN